MSEPGQRLAKRSGSLAAAVIGVGVGIATFAGMLGSGFLLYQRLYGDSWPALAIMLLVFGGLGAYLAWLLGVLAFSRIREPVGGEE